MMKYDSAIDLMMILFVILWKNYILHKGYYVGIEAVVDSGQVGVEFV